MARTLEIPAVAGLKDITGKLELEDFVILARETVGVIISPVEGEIHRYQAIKAQYEKEKKALEALPHLGYVFHQRKSFKTYYRYKNNF